MPANPTTLHIPVVFDVSGGATLFAESQPEDFVENHLQFTLDSAADSNGNTLTAADFSQCIYIGDQDQGDSLFYQSAESGRTIKDLSKKIANAIINGTLKNDIADTTKRVPKGGGSVDSSGEASFYNGGITDSNGTHFGECLVRVVAAHLVGHPLAQAIIKDENQIYKDISNNAYNKFVDQLNRLFGNDPDFTDVFPNLEKISDAEAVHVEKSKGVGNVVLKSLFEQMLSIPGRSASMADTMGREYGDQDDDLLDRTTVKGFPFITGDKLVFYVRVRAHLNFEESVASTVTDGDGNTISGDNTTDAVAATIATVFPGGQGADGIAVEDKYCWMGHPDNAGKSFNQQVTDDINPLVLDAHIWKITVTI